MEGHVSLRCLATFLLLYTICLVSFLGYYLTGTWGDVPAVKPGESGPSAMLGPSEGRHGPLPFSSYHRAPSQTSFSSARHVYKVPSPKNASFWPVKIVNPSRNGVVAENTTRRTAATTESVSLNAETDFQPLHHNSIFVYSAHYDGVRRPPVVTVIAIVNRSAMAMPDAKPINCVYRGGGVASTNVSGKLTIFPDHHGKNLAPGFIHCRLPPHSRPLTPSTTVSLSTPRDDGSTNAVRVQLPSSPRFMSSGVQLPQPRRYLYSFLVCFPPLHGNFGDVTLVVESLEMARVMGAQRAVVYNTSLTARVDAVLRHYVQRGFLDVLGWREPPEPVHYKAQMGAVNDCLLRNRHQAEFIVFMDFDEMIVPRIHDSWSGLIRGVQRNSVSASDFVRHDALTVTMSKKFMSRVSKSNVVISNSSDISSHSSKLNIGAFSFPSSIFLWDKASNLTNEELRFANRLHLPFLLKQRKTVELWLKREKTIVNPRTVDIMGIHRVASFLGRQKTLLVNESIGLLQHYRWYANVPSVKDTSILRFASILVQRMKNTLKALDIEH